MQAGDIVEIHQVTFDGTFKADCWLGARVLAVDGEKFLARLLSGLFADGFNEKWFPMWEVGNQWRRA